MLQIKTRFGEAELVQVSRGNWTWRINKINKDIDLESYGTMHRDDAEKEVRKVMRSLSNSLKGI